MGERTEVRCGGELDRVLGVQIKGLGLVALGAAKSLSHWLVVDLHLMNLSPKPEKSLNWQLALILQTVYNIVTSCRYSFRFLEG